MSVNEKSTESPIVTAVDNIIPIIQGLTPAINALTPEYFISPDISAAMIRIITKEGRKDHAEGSTERS